LQNENNFEQEMKWRMDRSANDEAMRIEISLGMANGEGEFS
jgi:hypothetical protein